MAVIHKLEGNPQIIEQDTIDLVRQLCDEAEKGEVTDIICIAVRANREGYVRAADFQDAWRLLGVLEVVKHRIIGPYKEFDVGK